jgi:PadR family transcriptional regulator, regulatory protein AphA
LSSIRLSSTSYIVLGFVSLLDEATPYDLKRMVAISVGHFWSFPHSQLYAEPDRLAQAGYLTVRQEDSGRRRKLYKLTDRGSQALSDWRSKPVEEPFEIRDPATLKLFFGADPAALAEDELELLLAELGQLEAIKTNQAAGAPEGPRLALDYGIHITRSAIEFWSEITTRKAPKPDRSRRDARARGPRR